MLACSIHYGGVPDDSEVDIISLQNDLRGSRALGYYPAHTKLDASPFNGYFAVTLTAIKFYFFTVCAKRAV